MKNRIMKKFLYIILIILIIFGLTSQSYAAIDIELTENAWEQLTPQMIQQAVDEGDEPSIINALNLLGSSGIVSFLGNSVDLAQKYLDLTDVIYDNLGTARIPTDIWSQVRSNIESYRIEAEMIIESNPTDNGNNNSGNNGNGNNNNNNNNSGNNGNGNNNNNNNKTWKDYSLSEYETEGIGVLWTLLKPVDMSSLSKDELVKYIQCIEAVYERRTEADSTTANEITQRREEIYDYAKENYSDVLEGTEAEKIINGGKPLYNNPLINYNPNETAENVTPDSIIADADTFMADGQSSDVATINQKNANIAFNSIYNVLLAIGITVTVIWGLIIAIKLMMSSVEEKAEYKKMLWPYLVGCIVIFGSFAIWKIVIVVMNNVL